MSKVFCEAFVSHKPYQFVCLFVYIKNFAIISELNLRQNFLLWRYLKRYEIIVIKKV